MNPAQYGRNGDNTMVHMNNREVAGLEALARANGTNLTINPTTGYPEAFNLLPTLAGIAGGALAGPWGAALASGATTTATTGSLEQGLLAGATAGAMSGIGNELANVGAEAAGQTALDETTKQMIQESVQSGATQGIGADQMATQLGQEFGSEITAAGMQPTDFFTRTSGSIPYVTEGPTIASQIQPGGMAPPGGFQPEIQPANLSKLTPSKYGQMYEGGKSLLSDSSGKSLGEFVSSQKIPLATAGAGMMGQAQYAAAEEMQGKKEAMDAEKAAQLEKTRQTIRQNYANVGRALPMNPYTGRPVFAEGGIVGLMDGGSTSPYTKDQFESDYDAAMAKESWMRSLPADVVEAIFGIKDPHVLNKMYEQSRGTEKKAAGGAVGNFNQAPRYLETGGMLGDGMSDDIPAMIDGNQPAALSDGEFVVPADVVSHLGNGSSDAGAQQLYGMMGRIRQARTGNKEQGKEINPRKMMPA